MLLSEFMRERRRESAAMNRKMRSRLLAAAVMVAKTLLSTVVATAQSNDPAVQLGPRPFYLVENMDEGELKQALRQCENGPFYRSSFSIDHRGAPLQFPEHTRESYVAAARMGAGVLECDVAFTKDRELVCRHAQCDLHTTTNILAVPELAAKCTAAFTPADAAAGTDASAKCCTSDLTLAEFKTLKGKMDASDPKATTIEDYMKGTADWRTDLYATTGTLMSHKESIGLFKQLGVEMTPELKEPEVPMPFEDNYTQENYAQQLVDEYKAAGVPPASVYPQSFSLEDVRYWISREPEFGAQAVFLDDRNDTLAGFDITKPESWKPSMQALADSGVKIIAPPLWMLVRAGENDVIEPSDYAKQAKGAGLKIITWTLERSGTLTDGGGWYYQTVNDRINNSGDTYRMLDVLAKEVGVIGVFTDWPATVTYYANCMKLP
jgi:glycerophosphoryl diester phosphodiesterase